MGDEVFGEIAGAYAEYALAPEDELALKPKRLSMEDAAALPLAGLTALLGLRDTARVQPGQRVLINGASGGVGSFAVQIAHALGAEVSAVCSARNAERMRAIGADHVIDYARTDFTLEAGRYDVIFDLVGSRGLRACLRALSAGGVYIASVGRLSWVLRAALLSLFARGRIKVLAASANTADLEALAELAESGACTPLIDQRYTLSQVPDALRRQSEGHSMGKSTVRVS